MAAYATRSRRLPDAGARASGSVAMSPLRYGSRRLAEQDADLTKRRRAALARARGSAVPAHAELPLPVDQIFDVRRRRSAGLAGALREQKIRATDVVVCGGEGRFGARRAAQSLVRGSTVER